MRNDQIGFDEVVFVSQRMPPGRLWRMKSDGSNQVPMANTFIGAATASISPNGKQIAYVKGDTDDAQDIYVANIDGTGERRVVSTPARNFLPAWSPDGKYLTFSTKVTGTWNIGIVDVESGVYRLVTNDAKGNLESTWHPNGHRLIFSSHRSGVQKLWSIDVDGSNIVQLTYGDWEDTGAKYSHDGRYVVFSSYKRWKYDIWLADLATGHLVPLTYHWQLDSGEGSFVDGDTSIVYSGREGLDSQIGKIGIDGASNEMVTHANQNSWTATR